jgi:hypothetical protein
VRPSLTSSVANSYFGEYGKKAGRDLTRIWPRPSENSRAVPSPILYTPPQSVELLNLAALPEAPTLPSVEEPLLRGSQREARV